MPARSVSWATKGRKAHLPVSHRGWIDRPTLSLALISPPRNLPCIVARRFGENRTASASILLPSWNLAAALHDHRRDHKGCADPESTRPV